jgi:MFS family permease
MEKQVYLLAQFFQTVQGYSPLQSGLRILPWTAMPIFIAPIAGALSDKIGGHRLMGTGLLLQATGLGWIAHVSTPTTPYADLVAPFVLSGIGMALFFAPVANVVLSSVRRSEEGQASGANNAIRELGGVFGVAVLASVFAHYGGYTSGASFAHGMSIAVWIGAALVFVGSVRCYKRQEEGQASGANNAIRELGGVFGVAVLASVFAHYGGYTSGASFAHGMSIAVWIGAALVFVGALASFAIPRHPRRAEAEQLEPAFEQAA